MKEDIFIMLSFQQYLEEGRDAPLYHATDNYSIKRILDKNTLISSTMHVPGYIPGKRSKGKYKDVVSLTRSIQFAHKWGTRKSQGYYFILELDQRRLSQRHKFVPYNHFGDDDFQNYDGGATRRSNDVSDYGFPINQYEENVIGNIKNLDQYLNKIIISDKVYKLYFSDKRTDRQDAVVEFGSELTFHPKLYYNGKFINAHYHK